MAAETDADRAGFLDIDEFGETVTWDRDGAESTFSALFQRRSVEGLGDFGAGVTHRVSTITCRDADLPEGAVTGDGLTARGIAYVVRTIEPDGTGMSLLQLEKA